MATSAFDPVDRTCLFFDQFEYSVSFGMRYANLLRCRSAQDIVKVAELRNQRFHHSSWGSNSKLDLITSVHISNVQDMHYHLTDFGADHKQVIHSHSVYVYANNPAALQRLVRAGDDYIQNARFQQAQLTCAPGIVQLKQSQYQYRTYFRERYQDTEPLRKFLKNRTDCFGYTREFGRRLLDHKFCVQRHNFVDHHSAADAVMLNLICANIVRTTLPIQAK